MRKRHKKPPQSSEQEINKCSRPGVHLSRTFRGGVGLHILLKSGVGVGVHSAALTPGWLVLWGVCPVHCKILNSLLNLCPKEPEIYPTPTVTTENCL